MVTDENSEIYELERCAHWIRDNNFQKVCLQFPDSLLKVSVEVALYLDSQSDSKTYILGDSSYASCCIDEVACQHVDGDALIHFGPACLSPSESPLPVLHIFSKRPLDLDKFFDASSSVFDNGDTLLIFDTSYTHLTDNLASRIPEKFKNCVTIASVISNGRSLKNCGPHCKIEENGKHDTSHFSRSYCLPSHGFKSFLYVGSEKAWENFLLLTKEENFFLYDEPNDLVQKQKLVLLHKLSFAVEKIKAAQRIGLVVGTLAVSRFLEAVDHVRQLCKRRRKKFHVICVGKPTPAKLSNFSEIDVFVIIACPETEYLDRKSIIQPIVGLLEIELALNENRSNWEVYSRNFSDFLEGAPDYVAVSETPPEEIVEVSLIDDKIHRFGSISSESTELTQKSENRLRTADFFSKPRSWDGLEVNLGDREPSTIEKGRSGYSQSYTVEKAIVETKAPGKDGCNSISTVEFSLM